MHPSVSGTVTCCDHPWMISAGYGCALWRPCYELCPAPERPGGDHRQLSSMRCPVRHSPEDTPTSSRRGTRSLESPAALDRALQPPEDADVGSGPSTPARHDPTIRIRRAHTKAGPGVAERDVPCAGPLRTESSREHGEWANQGAGVRGLRRRPGSTPELEQCEHTADADAASGPLRIIKCRCDSPPRHDWLRDIFWAQRQRSQQRGFLGNRRVSRFVRNCSHGACAEPVVSMLFALLSSREQPGKRCGARRRHAETGQPCVPHQP
jgi:hypothetical protein